MFFNFTRKSMYHLWYILQYACKCILFYLNLIRQNTPYLIPKYLNTNHRPYIKKNTCITNAFAILQSATCRAVNVVPLRHAYVLYHIPCRVSALILVPWTRWDSNQKLGLYRLWGWYFFCLSPSSRGCVALKLKLVIPK